MGELHWALRMTLPLFSMQRSVTVCPYGAYTLACIPAISTLLAPRSHAGPEPVLLLALAKDLLLHSHGSHSALPHNTHRGHSTRRIVGYFALLIRGYDVTEIGFVAAQHIAIRGGPQMNRRAAYQNVHPRHDGGIDVHNLLNIICVQVTFNEGVQGLIGCDWVACFGPASICTNSNWQTTAGFNLQIPEYP
jgi:hypothetical protein